MHVRNHRQDKTNAEEKNSGAEQRRTPAPPKKKKPFGKFPTITTISLILNLNLARQPSPTPQKPKRRKNGTRNNDKTVPTPPSSPRPQNPANTPPRKTKTSADPNNLTWARNTTTFGQKILRSQGWTPGHVLGPTDSSHAEFHSHASKTHLKAALRLDETAGLGLDVGIGGRIGRLVDPVSIQGGALEDVFARLNGRSAAEVQKVEEKIVKREELGIRVVGVRRYGAMRFVRGGLLVGDQLKEGDEAEVKDEVGVKMEVKDEDVKMEDIKTEDEPTTKKSKKRKEQADAREQDEHTLKKRRKEEKRAAKEAKKTRAVSSSSEDDDTDTTKKHKKSSKPSPNDAQMTDTKKSTKKNKNQPENTDSTDNTSPSPEQEDQDTKKAEKEQRRKERQEKRLRKAAKLEKRARLENGEGTKKTKVKDRSKSSHKDS